jgi:drug/metabolite transporter (DMT)-like permease
VFAHLLLHDEKMTGVKAVALLLGIAGVAAIFSHQFEIAGPYALRGSAAVVAGSACVAIAYVVMRRFGTHLPPGTVTVGQMLAAIGPLAVYAAVAEGNPVHVQWTRASVLAVLYLAVVGSIAGVWLNYWLLQRIGATRLLVMGLIEPLVAVMLGAIFLNETMTGWTLAGGICILLSVALVLDLFRKPPAVERQL